MTRGREIAVFDTADLIAAGAVAYVIAPSQAATEAAPTATVAARLRQTPDPR